MEYKSFQYLSEYFTPDILYRLSHIDIKPFKINKTFIKGYHKSKDIGYNIEYAEHKEYVPGEDIRRIDWKAYARQDRLYIKMQDEEESLKTDIFVDVSESMIYPEENRRKKIEHSLLLASGLAFIFMTKKDRVKIHFISDRIYPSIETQTFSFNDLISQIGNIPVGGKSNFELVFEQISEYSTKGSLAIVITDAITDKDIFLNGIKLLKYKGIHTAVAHLMSRYEINLEDTRPINYLDSEIDDKINIDPLSVKEEFRKKIEDFIEYISSSLRRIGVQYSFLLNEDKPIENIYKFLRNYSDV